MEKRSGSSNLYGPKEIDKILSDEHIIVNSIYYQARRIIAGVEVVIDLKNGLRYSCHATLCLHSIEKK